MKKNKRIYPTEESPRYGDKFTIVGIQWETIDHNFSELLDIKVMEKDNKQVLKIFDIGKTWGEWRKNKQKISDMFCEILNTPDRDERIKDVVAIKIHYFFSKPGEYHIV